MSPKPILQIPPDPASARAVGRGFLLLGVLGAGLPGERAVRCGRRARFRGS